MEMSEMCISRLLVLANFLANIAFFRLVGLMTGGIMSFAVGHVAQSFSTFEAGHASLGQRRQSHFLILLVLLCNNHL